MKHLTENVLKLFDAYVNDAGNWSGCPLIGGNVTLLGEKEDRGLLTALKRAGLVYTNVDGGDAWLFFTKDGIQVAAQRGHDVSCLTCYRPWNQLNR